MMTIDYVLGGLVTAGLLAYLVYALIYPERF
jgi:K+-transporting ATPase ATPase F chain